MRKLSSTVCIVLVLLFTASAFATNRVVVVPLGKKPTGDAVAADVMKGKTFSNKDEIGVPGTMPDSTQDIAPGSSDKIIPAGYHDGSGKVTTDPNLTAENIKKDITVFGVTGTYYCPAGLTECSGECVDTMNNPSFCGDCMTQCDAGKYCRDGICINKELGTACIDGPECISGNCVDGICCDTACSSECESCIEAVSGGVDGTCKDIPHGTDPENECTGDGPSYCNGSGSCLDTCFDGQINNDETDTDCGGTVCSVRCEVAHACLINSDCLPPLVCLESAGNFCFPAP